MHEYAPSSGSGALAAGSMGRSPAASTVASTAHIPTTWRARKRARAPRPPHERRCRSRKGRSGGDGGRDRAARQTKDGADSRAAPLGFRQISLLIEGLHTAPLFGHKYDSPTRGGSSRGHREKATHKTGDTSSSTDSGRQCTHGWVLEARTLRSAKLTGAVCAGHFRWWTRRTISPLSPPRHAAITPSRERSVRRAERMRPDAVLLFLLPPRKGRAETRVAEPRGSRRARRTRRRRRAAAADAGGRSSGAPGRSGGE